MAPPGQTPRNIGHRGHHARTENTIASFREAIELGSEMLELDVRLSKDAVPMVFHDKGLKRMTGLDAPLASLSAKELQALNLEGGGRIPTLRETLLELCPVVCVNVELKFDILSYRAEVDAVCSVLSELKLQHRVLVSSFFHQSLQMIARRLPELPIAPLFGPETGKPELEDLEFFLARPSWTADITELPFSKPAAVVYHKMIDQDLAQKFRQWNATLLTYTVDEVEEMERLIDLGLDGIITNRPACLRDILGR